MGRELDELGVFVVLSCLSFDYLLELLKDAADEHDWEVHNKGRS